MQNQNSNSLYRHENDRDGGKRAARETKLTW